MAEILTFRPRPKLVLPIAAVPLTGAALRDQIEAGAQAALDLADQLIGLLDRADGDADLEDGGDAEPALAAPENHEGGQIVWLRGGDRDCEAEAPEVVLPEVENRDRPDPVVLPWRGRRNIIAAAGGALLDLVNRPCR